MSSDFPTRRFKITIQAQGDSREGVKQMIDEFIFAIEDGVTSRVSGGCDTGGWFEVIEDARITPEIYRTRLAAYKAFTESMKF